MIDQIWKILITYKLFWIVCSILVIANLVVYMGFVGYQEEALTDLRNHARELASQDARELVERFGELGRRKLQLAG